jgi:hypothetical protein
LRDGGRGTANAFIDFLDATVALLLTPSGGTPVTVFSSQPVTFGSNPVTKLAPYESRVSLEAKNSNAQTSADFDVTNINVQYLTGHSILVLPRTPSMRTWGRSRSTSSGMGGRPGR